MHDNIVLDSSIISAIFFTENISGKAIEIAEAHDCITVDLAYAEVANVAWKRVNHASQDPDAAKNALNSCNEFISETCRVLPTQDLIPAAFDLARCHRITVYDALFLAAAIQSESPLATADKKLHHTAKKVIKSELIQG